MTLLLYNLIVAAMASLFNALFGSSSAQPPMSPTPTACSRCSNPDFDTHAPMSVMTHVRCNLKERFVSAKDALHYMIPKQEDSFERRINRLPRVAYLKAFWPACKETQASPDSHFKAVSFDNLHLLFDEEDGTAENIVSRVEAFVEELQYTELNPSMYPIMLGNEAKLTSAQKRYKRDLTDRLLNPDKYYGLKHKRDAKFRAKKAANKKQAVKKQKPLVCKACDRELDADGNGHWLWCKQPQIQC